MLKIIGLCFLFVLVAAPAWANFSEGQARFSGGDYKGAYEKWLPLAEKGEPRAQYSVGVLFLQGLGVEKDLEEAARWFDKAAQQNYAPASAALRALRAQPEQAQPGVTTTPRPPATGPYPRPLDEREQIEVLVHELVRQANLQLRTGHLDYQSLEVSESGDGFDVVLGGLAMYGDPGQRLLIGDLVARVGRIGDRYYQIGFTLPDTLYGYDAEREKPSEIYIARQSNVLVWDRDLELMVDVDVIWGGLKIVEPGGREAGRIEEIAMVSDLQEQGGLWSGPVSFTMRGIDVADGRAGHLSLGEIGLRAEFEKLDMVRYAALSRAVSQGEQRPSQTLESIKGLLAGVKLDIFLNDLQVSRPQAGEVGLARASYRLGFLGLDRRLALLEMAWAHGGLSGQPPDVPELAPRDAKIRFVFDRLPVETLLRTGITAALEFMLFGEVGTQGDVLNELRVSLSQAQTEFRIDDGRFEGPSLLVTIAGILSADAQALWGVSGEIGTTVLGLEKLLEAYEADRPTQGNSSRPSFAEMLRSLGQLGPDGKTYIYNFALTRQGQLLVNGQDAGPLVAAFFSG